jgi:hypothetical protein
MRTGLATLACLELVVGVGWSSASDKAVRLDWVQSFRSNKEFVPDRFTLQIPDPAKGTTRPITLANETTKIYDAVLRDDLLVVDGAYATTAGLVTILDAGSGEELDAFFCWYHRISPTGKYVQFVQFYPRFTDPELVSHALVLYRVADARRRPVRKRVPFQQYPRMYDAGTPIYPEKNYRERSHDFSLDGKQHSLSRVLWFKNDTRRAFLDFVEGKRWLVTIDLGKGLDSLEFAKRQITVPGEAALGLDTWA